MKKHATLILTVVSLWAAAQGDVTPGRAFLYSLFVPGAGQRANGEEVKSGIFLMTEIICFSGAMFFSNQHELSEKRFVSFADTHFYYAGSDPDRKSYTEMWEYLKDRVYAKSNLPYEKVGEYYELIGKLPELRQFWDDPAQQDLYYDMRQDSNGYYKTMNAFWGALIVNHLASAVDAFISAKSDGVTVRGGFGPDGSVGISVDVMLR